MGNEGRLNDVIRIVNKEKGIEKLKDGEGKTALMFASLGGNLEVVKFLSPLSKMNEKSNHVWTALLFACYQGHLDVVRWLLQNGASIFEKVKGKTPLLWASDRGHLSLVQWLVSDYGCSVAERSK